MKLKFAVKAIVAALALAGSAAGWADPATIVHRQDGHASDQIPSEFDGRREGNAGIVAAPHIELLSPIRKESRASNGACLLSSAWRGRASGEVLPPPGGLCLLSPTRKAGGTSTGACLLSPAWRGRVPRQGRESNRVRSQVFCAVSVDEVFGLSSSGMFSFL
ncbi:MAG: hypothetical protein LBO00_07100, partial [Zoogloeaceae bacterium]|nr:hypothetical protein [Zoogloeaceae bacterium]